MNFIDICAGIGGFRSGLELAGHECKGFIEIDKYARKSYKAMYDTTNEWTAYDLKEVKPNEIPNVDLWCFGFPCQDISVAGKQKGLQGERSGIFYTIIKLLKGKSAEDRPKWLLVENVKNLLSIDGGRAFTEVLSEISEAGYDCEWHLVNSKDFGVPQNRERIFIIGHLRDGSGRELLPLTGTSEQASSKRQTEQAEPKINLVHNNSRKNRERVVNPDGLSRCLTSTDYKEPQKVAVPKQIVSGNQAHRVYDSNGASVTIKAEGGGVGAKTGLYAVPKIKKILGSTQHFSVMDCVGISPTLAACDYKDPTKITIPKVKSVNTPLHNGNFIQSVEGLSRSVLARDYKDPQLVAIPKEESLNQIGGYCQSHRIYSTDGLGRTLTGVGYGIGGSTGLYAIPCLTPDRVNKRQNGRRFKEPNDPMFTLTAQDRHGVLVYKNDEYNIRRLTPKECFRLQGFTDEQFEKAEAVNSNSQLYKQAGNAVTVNVAYLIGKYLKETEDEIK